MEAAAAGGCSQWGFSIRATNRCCETLAPEGSRRQVGRFFHREENSLTIPLKKCGGRPWWQGRSTDISRRVGSLTSCFRVIPTFKF